MIIAQVTGGLGNQLNVYSFYLWAKQQGKGIKLDTGFYDKKYAVRGGSDVDRSLELIRIGLHYDQCTKKEREKYTDDNMNVFNRARRLFFGNKTNVIDTNDIQDMQSIFDAYLCGSFNPSTYGTIEVVEQMRKNIKYPISQDARNHETLKKIQETQSVAVHIRRADYLKVQNQYLNIATEQYYESAIRYVKQQYPQAHFFIFSDDKDYIRENYLGNEFSVVDWNTEEASIYDLMLMQNCKHNITAKSTFSQWAARLNDNPEKIVVVPVEAGGARYIIEKEYVWIDSNGNLVPDVKK